MYVLSALRVIVTEYTQQAHRHPHLSSRAYTIDDVRYIVKVLPYHSNICLRNPRQPLTVTNADTDAGFTYFPRVIGYLRVAQPRLRSTSITSFPRKLSFDHEASDALHERKSLIKSKPHGKHELSRGRQACQLHSKARPLSLRITHATNPHNFPTDSSRLRRTTIWGKWGKTICRGGYGLGYSALHDCVCTTVSSEACSAAAALFNTAPLVGFAANT